MISQDNTKENQNTIPDRNDNAETDNTPRIDTAKSILVELYDRGATREFRLSGLSHPERVLIQSCAQALAGGKAEQRKDILDRVVESTILAFPELAYLTTDQPKKETKPKDTKVRDTLAKLKKTDEELEEEEEEQEPDTRLIHHEKLNKPVFKVYSDADVLAFPDIEYMIDGFLPKVGTTIVVAESGTGKSYLMIDLANHIARGLNWKGHRIRKAGRVLMIYAEGKLGLKPRSIAWRKHYTHEKDLTTNIDYLPVHMDIMHDAKYLRATIDATLEDDPYALIIVDTFSNVTPGRDQNKQEAVTEVLQMLNYMAERYQTQILITHHTNKTGTTNGSMGFKNHVDTKIELSSSDQGENITVHCDKQRQGAAKFDDFQLKRELVEIGFDAETLAPTFEPVLVLSESQESIQTGTERDEQERMLDILRVHTTLSARQWISECKEVKISKRVFYQHVDRLKELSCVTCEKSTRSGQADKYVYMHGLDVKQEACTPCTSVPGTVCTVI